MGRGEQREMMARLGDIATYVNGYAFNPSDWSDTGLPIIRIQDLTGNAYQANRYNGEYDKKYEVNAGDILISWSASLGVYVWGGEKAVLNQHIFKVVFDKAEINKSFFVHQVQNILENAASQAHGATMKHLTKPVFDALPFYLPSMKDQHYIASILDKVGNLISLRKQQLAKLDELVKARFVEMFGEIMETVPLCHYVNALIAGKSLAGEKECPNKVLKTGAATYDSFDPTQVKNLPLDYVPQPEHLLKTGDVIISRMNTLELVGAAAYVWEAPSNTYLPDRLWRAELHNDAQPIFVWQMLIQATTKESIRRIASGTSGSMKNISKSDLLGIQVKKVDFENQKNFSTLVTQIYRKKLTIQQSLDKLEVLKKSLMQKYFGGV